LWSGPVIVWVVMEVKPPKQPEAVGRCCKTAPPPNHHHCKPLQLYLSPHCVDSTTARRRAQPAWGRPTAVPQPQRQQRATVTHPSMRPPLDTWIARTPRCTRLCTPGTPLRTWHPRESTFQLYTWCRARYPSRTTAPRDTSARVRQPPSPPKRRQTGPKGWCHAAPAPSRPGPRHRPGPVALSSCPLLCPAGACRGMGRWAGRKAWAPHADARRGPTCEHR
jgi:hypothetical protein